MRSASAPPTRSWIRRSVPTRAESAIRSMKACPSRIRSDLLQRTSRMPVRGGWPRDLVDRARHADGRVVQVGQLGVQPHPRGGRRAGGRVDLPAQDLDQLGELAGGHQVVHQAQPGPAGRNVGRLDARQVLAGEPTKVSGTPRRRRDGGHEERDVQGEDLAVVDPLALVLPERQEVVDRAHRRHPVDQVPALVAALGDRQVVGLPLAPPVDRLGDHVDGRGRGSAPAG